MKNLIKFSLMFMFLAINSSCSKEEGCATENTGKIIIENTNSQHSLHFYKNSSNSSGSGDLVVAPKSKESITLPAGNYTTLILLFTGSCNEDGSVCIKSWSTLDNDKELDLSSCEDLNLVY